MRFLIDHDVDVQVGVMLRRHRHEAFVAGQVGLALAGDDSLTVWATNRNAAVVSTDKGFGRRRLRNAYGGRVWMRCDDVQIVDILEMRLDEVVERLRSRTDITVVVSKDVIWESGDWA